MTDIIKATDAVRHFFLMADIKPPEVRLVFETEDEMRRFEYWLAKEFQRLALLQYRDDGVGSLQRAEINGIRYAWSCKPPTLAAQLAKAWAKQVMSEEPPP